MPISFHSIFLVKRHSLHINHQSVLFHVQFLAVSCAVLKLFSSVSSQLKYCNRIHQLLNINFFQKFIKDSINFISSKIIGQSYQNQSKTFIVDKVIGKALVPGYNYILIFVSIFENFVICSKFHDISYMNSVMPILVKIPIKEYGESASMRNFIHSSLMGVFLLP